jgi:hypothetical protein
MNAEQGGEMSNHQTWAGIVCWSRRWLRSGSGGRGRGIRLHMKAHKAYLDTLRMEAR